MSKEQWVSNAIAERKANSYQGNVGIFGTVYVMCLVSVIQMAVSGAMARTASSTSSIRWGSGCVACSTS